MKITKYVLGLLFGLVSLVFASSKVLANEGVLNMRSVPAGSGACFVASVYVDGAYKVLLTCRDLKAAVSAEQNRYVAWVEQEDGKITRLGEIVNGKLSTSSTYKFTKVFVTIETDAYAAKPSSLIVMGGTLMGIDFSGGQVSTNVPVASPTPTVYKKSTVTNTAEVEQNTDVKVASSGGLGSVLGSIVRIALMGFALLLVIVGVFSFLSRRRSL